MKLIQRVGYYLGGFSLGLIILAFFLSGKKTSCSYGPDARVIKNITQKKIVFSDNTSPMLNNYNLDTISIKTIIQNGNVNFAKSNARQKPCGVYVIESYHDNKTVKLSVENCDSIATLTDFKFIP